MLALREWLRQEQSQRYIERPCIGCLRPFRKWDVGEISLAEQFCSGRCKASFHHGYMIGLNVKTDLFERWRRRTDGGEWWR